MLPLETLSRFRTFLCVLTILGLASPAHADAAPDDLCLGDPCVITGSHLLDDATVFDFDSRDVVVQGILDVGAGGVGVTILAGSVTITTTGQIRGIGGFAASGGGLNLAVDRDVVIEGALAAGAIALTGIDGGILQITALTGSISGAGRIDLSATASAGFGGTLDLDAGGGISLTGPVVMLSPTTGSGLGGDATLFADGDVVLSDIDLRGGSLGGGSLKADSILGGIALGVVRAQGVGALGGSAGGGSVTASAGMDLSVSSVDVSGQTSGGGTIALDAQGSVTLGPVTADGAGSGGFGGSLVVDSVGPITLQSTTSARGSVTLGDGGSISLTAGSASGGANITVNGPVQVEGRGGGVGGDFTASGAEVRLVGGISAANLASAAVGGAIDIDAQDLLSVTGPLTAGGGTLVSGTVMLAASGTLNIQTTVRANGVGAGAAGGLVSVLAGGPLSITAGTLSASGGAASDPGGSVVLSGCSVSATAGTVVEAKNGAGSIFIDAGSNMTLAGTYTGGTGGGQIRLRYGIAQLRPLAFSAVFSPAATQVFTATLKPCASQCGAVDTDGDGRGDGCDTCPYAFDPAQIDRGGLGIGTLADGIGDECQCGDVNGDGRVTVVDATILTRSLLNPPTATMTRPELCDVGGSLVCGTADAVILRRAQLAPPTATIVRQCPPARH